MNSVRALRGNNECRPLSQNRLIVGKNQKQEGPQEADNFRSSSNKPEDKRQVIGEAN